MEKSERDYLKGMHDAYAEVERFARQNREGIHELIEESETEEALLCAIKKINQGLDNKLHNVVILRGGKLL